MPQGARHAHADAHRHAYAAHCNADGCSRRDVQRAGLPHGDTPASDRNTDTDAYASPHGDAHAATASNPDGHATPASYHDADSAKRIS